MKFQLFFHNKSSITDEEEWDDDGLSKISIFHFFPSRFLLYLSPFSIFFFIFWKKTGLNEKFIIATNARSLYCNLLAWQFSPLNLVIGQINIKYYREIRERWWKPRGRGKKEKEENRWMITFQLLKLFFPISCLENKLTWERKMKHFDGIDKNRFSNMFFFLPFEILY